MLYNGSWKVDYMALRNSGSSRKRSTQIIVRDNDIFKMSANQLYKPLLSKVFKCMTGVFFPTFPHQIEEDQRRKWKLIIIAAKMRK